MLVSLTYDGPSDTVTVEDAAVDMTREGDRERARAIKHQLCDANRIMPTPPAPA